MAKKISVAKKSTEQPLAVSEPDYSKIVTPELIALRRAAKEAIRIALATDTHAWILVDGKIVDAARPIKQKRLKKAVKQKGPSTKVKAKSKVKQVVKKLKKATK